MMTTEQLLSKYINDEILVIAGANFNEAIRMQGKGHFEIFRKKRVKGISLSKRRDEKG